MTEQYVLMDRRHDDFYERLTEQRIRKVNNLEQPGMEDSLLFPVENLCTAPVKLTQKRVSISSSDSGINSLHVL